MPRPHTGVARRRQLRAPVWFALVIQHVLEIESLLDEFVGRKISRPAPDFFERIDQAHGIVSSLAGTDSIRKLALVFDKSPIPHDGGRGGLVLLEKNLGAACGLG